MFYEYFDIYKIAVYVFVILIHRKSLTVINFYVMYFIWNYVHWRAWLLQLVDGGISNPVFFCGRGTTQLKKYDALSKDGSSEFLAGS